MTDVSKPIDSCDRQRFRLSSLSSDDEAFMMQVGNTPRMALGRTFPNPAVDVPSRQTRYSYRYSPKLSVPAFHPRAGLPHASICSLEAAGTFRWCRSGQVNDEPVSHRRRGFDYY
jgi:hypothetical protein